MKTEAPSEVGFKSEQIFSGFDPKHRLQLHETIFDLIWYGAGRWSWDDLYSMPIFLRRYWVKRVNAKISDETEQAKKIARRSKSAKTSVPTKRHR